MKQIKFLLFFLILSGSICQSQNKKIDSLNAIVNSQKHDTIKGAAFGELARIYIKKKDTVAYFSAIEKMGRLYKKTQFQKMGSLYYLIQAVFEENIHENNERTLDYFLKSLTCSEKINDKQTIGKRLNKISKLYIDLGKYKEAINNFYRAVKVNEESGNLVGESYSYFGLGEVFRLQKNSKKALEAFYNGYAIAQKTQDPAGLSASYSNIGMIYNSQKQLDSALYYYNKNLDFNTKRNNEQGVAETLDRISTIYLSKKDNLKAIELLERSLKIKLKFGNKREIAKSYINLAEAYNELKKLDEASKNVEKAMALSVQLNQMLLVEYCYKLQGIIYNNQGKYDKSVSSLLKYIEVHDSSVNMQTGRLAAELEGKYQNEKKKKEIELLNKDKVLQDINIKKQKQFSYFIALVAILLALTVFLIFRGLKQKQKDNKMLSEKNEIINEQKNIVEEKNKEITDSINYAKRIQYALLASDGFLNQHLSSYFVLFKPKDIVSGDFYWAASVETKLAIGSGQAADKLPTANRQLFYLAVCDSTGHGVPGAFMSLLNIGFLSEAVKEKNILEPNSIFNYVRDRLVETISGEGHKDGFDGILLCIDVEMKQITYAAANNSPIIVSNGVLKDLQTNKMPVGFGEKKDSFDLFTIDYTSGDTLYLFTDGYPDQFGGPRGKKFMHKKLSELLLNTSSKPINEQNLILKTTFDDWKGGLEQVDDVCIIGIKL